MVAETSLAQAPASASLAGVWRARLGSLLAVVPLGVWTFVHLWNNLSAFEGADRWQEQVTGYAHPVAQLLTFLVVLLPIVLHGVWGVGRLLTTHPNNVRYPTFANLKYLLQRVSALVVVFFLGVHLWLAMLRPRLQEGRPEAFADLAREMHTHLPTLVLYLCGTLAVAYHLANGLSTFALGWGIVSSRRALRRVDALAAFVFVLLLAMAWGALYALWAAGA